MIVYVVRAFNQDGEDWIEGIFSTEELAKNYAQNLKFDGRCLIGEWEVDSNKKGGISIVEIFGEED